jgi:mannose-6-phosphate isomerase-like protein (cupin superfamily)
VFLVIEGHLQINLRDKTLRLNEGELVVIPKGVEHKTIAREKCTVLLIEPIGTINTGNAGGEMTETSLEYSIKR